MESPSDSGFLLQPLKSDLMLDLLWPNTAKLFEQ
jgi:hypothetical protein